MRKSEKIYNKAKEEIKKYNDCNIIVNLSSYDVICTRTLNDIEKLVNKEIKKEFNLTDAQLERVIAQMKAQEEGNAPTYTDADAEQIAASLIDGGWTSEDAEEIQEAYGLTLGQARQVVEAMQAYEQEAKAERINAIVDDLNNLEEELLEVAEEIAEDCEAEGYPTHGTTFELRYEQEKARVNTKIDILLEEAEALGATLKYIYNCGVWEIVKN